MDGVFFGRPQSFRYQCRPADQCSRDEGEWRKTAEQGSERSTAKWIVAEKIRAGQRHTVVCPNVTETIEVYELKGSPMHISSFPFIMYFIPTVVGVGK